MAAETVSGMLDPDQLREIDRTLLSYLDEGRVTPGYCNARLEDNGEDYSRGYVQERLARLVEHRHAENLYSTGLYELIDDPRENTDA